MELWCLNYLEPSWSAPTKVWKYSGMVLPTVGCFGGQSNYLQYGWYASAMQITSRADLAYLFAADIELKDVLRRLEILSFEITDSIRYVVVAASLSNRCKNFCQEFHDFLHKL